MEKNMRIATLFVLCFSSLFAFTAKDYTHLYGMRGFDKNLLSMHFTLYNGYVKTATTMQAGLAKMAGDRSLEYGAFKKMYGWEYDGMVLHEYYFENLGGKGKPDKKSPLYRQILKDFTSFDAWKKDFIATGMIRGIGWAILYFDAKNGMLTNAWINEHDLGHLAGNTPILVMDVFEHAYMPQYGLKREEYIEAFFENIDWNQVESRFQ